MKRILVVDDDVAMGSAVRDVIEALGFSPILCGGGGEAVPRIGEFDALITDFLMPNGINGAELAEIVKRLRPNMPVAIMSGTIDLIPKDHVADKVFEKPFHIAELKEWLEKIG
jgi:CheY-like chemotaxis protein